MFGLRNSGTDLKILIRKSHGITILDLRGKSTFDNSGSEVLREELRRLSDNGVSNLLLNVEKLTQVDSSCIGVLVRAYVSLTHKGGSLKLLRPRDRVKMVLNVFHLLDTIPNFEDEGQALASFGVASRAGC
jgi:stage II sporulation protein AA (anti-sigma F factor antagonist)